MSVALSNEAPPPVPAIINASAPVKNSDSSSDSIRNIIKTLKEYEIEEGGVEHEIVPHAKKRSIQKASSSLDSIAHLTVETTKVRILKCFLEYNPVDKSN